MIEVIQLSNYVRPEIKEVSGKKYVLNGEKNSFYDYIIARYKGSPTNRAIIDSYAKFIYGKGLCSKQQNVKANDFANIKRLLSKNDLRGICQDRSLFSEAAIELIYKEGKLLRVKHVAKNQIVPSKIDENGDITSYWFSQDFKNVQKYVPIEIDSFKFKEIKNGSLIYVITNYQAGKTYFSDPTYLAGLVYAELEEEIANYCVNHIKNGLSTGYFVNMNNGVPESEEAKDAIVKDIKKNATGSNNAGRIVVTFNENKDKAPTIEALAVSEAHKQYEFLSSESGQKLMIAHRVISSAILGLDKSSGFSSNADEITTAFDETMTMVIQPMQEEILDALMEIFQKAGYSIDLDFIPLRAKAPTQLHTQLSTDEADDIIADALIDLGEVIDENEWDLMDAREQKGSPELTETAFKLAYAPSNFPERESSQDTNLFKIRYSYEGSQTPQREFCRKMVGASKVYRKEDIEMASKKAVNKGLGENGSATYDLFLYKGGANCHHFWMRRIYLKKDNEQISSKQARDLLNALDPDLRKEANFEQNDPLVALKPSDMINGGFAN